VLFFALYATLAELEEEVVLRAPDRAGVQQDLRLWVVDPHDAMWITMPTWRAEQQGLEDAEVELTRAGETVCVPSRVLRDRETTDLIFKLRYDHYAVQRLATAIGVFGRSADPATVTVGLEGC
jgi:hypothetical protein